MSTTREIELKFDVSPADAIRLRDLAFLREREPTSIEQVSTYFDTARGRLAKSGLTVRIRRAGGSLVQTVKAEGESRALFDRCEWEAPVDGLAPDPTALEPTPVPALLARKHKDIALLPRFTVEVERLRWEVAEEDGTVELLLDRGAIEAGGTTQPVCEIELELVAGSPGLMFALARALDAAIPIRIGVLSKSERGQRLVEGAENRVTKAEPVRLDPAMRADDALVAIAWSCIRHFRLNEPLLLATGDPEALHQARVALRRLRSAFSLFSRLVAGDEAASIRAELRWVANLLGQARDLDVFLGRSTELDPIRRKELADRRVEAVGRAIGALESSRFRTLMIEVVRWLMLGRWRSGELAGQPVAELAADILDRFHRKLRRAGGSDLAALDDHHRHQVRIEAKKLRYGSEFFAELFSGGRARKHRSAFLKRLEALQEVLGDLNDRATARALELDVDGAGDPDEAAALLATAKSAYVGLIEARPFWR